MTKKDLARLPRKAQGVAAYDVIQPKEEVPYDQEEERKPKI
jgi:hypothetical protein